MNTTDMPPRFRIATLSFLTACLAFATALHADAAIPFPAPGHRPIPPGTHVLSGAKVVAKPDQIIENGSILIRHGLIADVGRELDIPDDARIWDMQGRVIYAGLIDPYVVMEGVDSPLRTSMTDDADWEEKELTSGGVRFFGVPGGERDPGKRGAGSEWETVNPQYRVAEHFSLSVKQMESLRELGFTAANLVPSQGIFRGTSALVALAEVDPNEALIRADVAQHVAFDTDASSNRAYPRSLMGVISAIRQTFFDAAHYREDFDHYRRNAGHRTRPAFNPALAALEPFLKRNAPVIFEPGSVLMVARSMALARELDVQAYLVSSGEEWRRPDLVEALDTIFIVPVGFPEVPKMPEEDDWDQVSLDQLRAWDWAPENPALLRDQGQDIAFTLFGLGQKKNFRKNLRLALERGLPETDAVAALTTVPAEICGVSERLGTIEEGKAANLTIVKGDTYFSPDATLEAVWIDGRVYPIKPGEKEKDEAKPEEVAKDDSEEDDDEESNSDDDKKSIAEPRKTRAARSPVEGRGPLAEPPAVLVRGATVWTCGPEGIKTNADLLIVDGRVRDVAADLSLPRRLRDEGLVIDGSTLHVTPGLIDAHNHSMILGGVNEGSLPSSAMVRVEDVVNSETANLRRQLAGGLTVANLLHGSANPIGGQNAIIKLKDGAPPQELKMEGAPPGIKFALGENVKQSNWGDDNTTRFPQTRMGVPTFMANRFTAARQYLDRLENRRRTEPPVARNLELEALGEILEGERWIHCHSYRQDEILAFLRLMETFDVQVGTLQHVLEGYKIADEIARHGAGASCFSDWWAYKYEVIDAIPYAGSLMHERGALVSFNSDSSDQARRMNLEAAKAVKYGGTSEIEALNFVVLNPAKQLRIDDRVGSLEPGKDGDFAVWSGSPLDSRSVCLQTWIEGKKYFDRDLEARRIESLSEEREELLAKARLTRREKEEKDEPNDARAEEKFFDVSLEHRYDAINRHCMDHE